MIYKSKIVLFYTGSIEPQAIVEAIKDSVPEYMIPNKKGHLKKKCLKALTERLTELN